MKTRGLSSVCFALLFSLSALANTMMADVPTFNIISRPLIIHQEGGFTNREWERMKQDLHDPWSWGAVFTGYAIPYHIWKRWTDKYEYPGGQTHSMEVGEMQISNSVLAGLPLKVMGPFELRQASVPLVIKPTWKHITDFADDFSHVGLEFTLLGTDNDKSPAQITDILPNTAFSPANYGGKAIFRVGITANQQWGPVAVEGSAKGLFWWEWNPKVNIIASGAAANRAFVILNKKPDGTGWIGKLPIEVLFLAPASVQRLDLYITALLVYKNDLRIPLAESVTGIYLYH